jgi:ribosomal protein L37AE/L43A
MSESRLHDTVTRPTTCPFCTGRVIDTLAKTITVTTFWRCRECGGTWTIASHAASSARRSYEFPHHMPQSSHCGSNRSGLLYGWVGTAGRVAKRRARSVVARLRSSQPANAFLKLPRVE